MSMFVPESRVDILYQKFSNQAYVSREYWNATRDFKLDPLYQHNVTEYIVDLKLQKHQHEFILDTSLVPPPGNDPESSDFQSAA